jgi:hypothetical protein
MKAWALIQIVFLPQNPFHISYKRITQPITIRELYMHAIYYKEIENIF